MGHKFTKNDEAVSAVIGVILMVAITVILAAVIAAFVFGMGSSIKKTYIVVYTIERSNSGENTIIITNYGGPDVEKLSGVYVTSTIGTVPANPQAGLLTVGDTISITGATSTAHVVVTGKFKDGTAQVLSAGDY